jgi:hypothetical protein
MAAAAIAASTVIAACGSTSPISAGSGGQQSLAQIRQSQQDMVKFVQCMGSHGVPLPNPTTSPRAFKNAFPDHPSPTFQSAYTVCEHLQPGGGPPNQSTAPSQARTAALLAFARCLRNHGFPNFPDPNSSGQVTHQMLAQAGINLQQPAILQTADACVGVTHGVLTRAAVTRFVAGQ